MFKYPNPVARTVEHGASNTQIMGSIPREWLYEQNDTINAVQVPLAKSICQIPQIFPKNDCRKVYRFLLGLDIGNWKPTATT